MGNTEDKTEPGALQKEVTDPNFPPVSAIGAEATGDVRTGESGLMNQSGGRTAGDVTQPPDLAEATIPDAPALTGTPAPNPGGIDNKRLLKGLRYRRLPDPVHVTADSAGLDVAVHPGGVYELPSATRTPVPLPPVVVERTIPPTRSVQQPPAPAATPFIPEQAEPPPVYGGSASRPIPLETTVVPRRPKPLLLAGVLGILVVLVLGGALAMVRPRGPVAAPLPSRPTALAASTQAAISTPDVAPVSPTPSTVTSPSTATPTGSAETVASPTSRPSPTRPAPETTAQTVLQPNAAPSPPSQTSTPSAEAQDPHLYHQLDRKPH